MQTEEGVSGALSWVTINKCGRQKECKWIDNIFSGKRSLAYCDKTLKCELKPKLSWGKEVPEGNKESSQEWRLVEVTAGSKTTWQWHLRLYDFPDDKVLTMMKLLRPCAVERMIHNNGIQKKSWSDSSHLYNLQAFIRVEYLYCSQGFSLLSISGYLSVFNIQFIKNIDFFHIIITSKTFLNSFKWRP